MFSYEPEQPKRPRLQLEYSGEGPGSRGRTSIGCEDGDQTPIDRSGLPKVPWWFIPLLPIARGRYRSALQDQPLASAMSFLEAHGVPPLYRLGLGLQWDFINQYRDKFTEEDFAIILGIEPKENTNFYDATPELLEIEARAIYHLWKRRSWRLG